MVWTWRLGVKKWCEESHCTSKSVALTFCDRVNVWVCGVGFKFQPHFSLVFSLFKHMFQLFHPCAEGFPQSYVHPTGLRPFATQPCRCISYGNSIAIASCLDSIEVQTAIEMRVTPGMPGWNESKQVPQEFGTLHDCTRFVCQFWEDCVKFIQIWFPGNYL